jgi:hypothetical protein
METLKSACKLNDIKCIKKIITNDSFSWIQYDQYGMYPIHILCKFGNNDIINWIICTYQTNIDWNVYNWNEHTCLFMIMSNPKLTNNEQLCLMTKCIIECSANPYQVMNTHKPYLLFDVFIHMNVSYDMSIWIQFFKMLYPPNYKYNHRLLIFLKERIPTDTYQQLIPHIKSKLTRCS